MTSLAYQKDAARAKARRAAQKALPVPEGQMCENGCGNPAKYHMMRLVKTETGKVLRWFWSCAKHHRQCPVTLRQGEEHRQATHIARYGSKFAPEFTEKKAQTSLERYGVIAAFSASKLKPHSYYFSTTLLELAEKEGVDLKEVKVGDDVPIVPYEYEGQLHQFLPDFYIPSRNLLIAIRSEYEYNNRQESVKSMIKKQAAIALGYECQFRIRGRRLHETIIM